MGKNLQDDDEPKDADEPQAKEDYVDSSEDEVKERTNYDIEPVIQELAYAFNIDDGLTQRLNDVMIEERAKTWSSDIDELWELLKDCDRPAAMLNLKVRDMEAG